MTDTSAEMDTLYRSMLRARSPGERLRMATGMFALARKLTLASLPGDLSPAELRRAVFQRWYRDVPLDQRPPEFR